MMTASPSAARLALLRSLRVSFSSVPASRANAAVANAAATVAISTVSAEFDASTRADGISSSPSPPHNEQTRKVTPIHRQQVRSFSAGRTVPAHSSATQRRQQSSWTRARMAAASNDAGRQIDAFAAHTGQHQRQQQHLARRRLTVNGKKIPLHVRDLNSSVSPSAPWGNDPPAGRGSSNSNSTLAYADNDDDTDYEDVGRGSLDGAKRSGDSVQDSIWGRPAASGLVQTPREYESDLVVVLDLDECLVHTKFNSQLDAHYAWQVLQRQRRDHDVTVDTFPIELSDGTVALVHERPFVRDFLQRVSEQYETHIYTAAMSIYAEEVLKVLDPHSNMITKAWYRESCDVNAKHGALVKNLNRLETSRGSHRPQRTVLVDNNPLSFLSNPRNGILIPSFYDDPYDKSLLSTFDLIRQLDEHHEDVRPVLDARFDLRNALNKLDQEKDSVVDSPRQKPKPHVLSFAQAAATF